MQGNLVDVINVENKQKTVYTICIKKSWCDTGIFGSLNHGPVECLSDVVTTTSVDIIKDDEVALKECLITGANLVIISQLFTCIFI